MAELDRRYLAGCGVEWQQSGDGDIRRTRFRKR
jgi:hypothetical protein